GDPGRELVVGQRSLSSQLLEIRVELLIERTDASWADELVWDGHAREAREPDPVGQQEMVERSVDRLEERAAVALARFVTQRGGTPVERVVHPAVVVSQGTQPFGTHGAHITPGRRRGKTWKPAEPDGRVHARRANTGVTVTIPNLGVEAIF